MTPNTTGCYVSPTNAFPFHGQIMPSTYEYDTTIDVDIVYNMPWVTIRDTVLINPAEDIFLQGHEAEAFVTQVHELMVLEPDMPMDVAERIVATPYTDIWC